jgi:ABC-type branched-subunit amino acid transport system ATPase component
LGARLEVRGLVKRFGGLAALDGLDLALAAGELRALVGPNGCGKSTLFNLISGALAPDAGAILLNGADVAGWTPCDAARAGVGRKFQSPALFDDLSAAENVLVPRWLRRLSAGPEEARERLAAFRLSARSRALARDLSHGSRRKPSCCCSTSRPPD